MSLEDHQNPPNMSPRPVPGPRKRVSQACRACGIKKIKCDGGLPGCTPCLQRQIQCEYGISKRSNRNTGSPRSRAHQLPPNSATQLQRDEKVAVMDQSMSPRGPQIPRIIASRPPGLSTNLPPEISARLFQIYFNYVHPLWPILYKPMYASLDYVNPTIMMAPALVAAIFAVASGVEKQQALATNTIIQKYPEPRSFAEEAIDLLLQGTRGTTEPGLSGFSTIEPSILSCQVLTLLSLQHHGAADYSRAGVLCGLASTMAIELKLHRPDITGDSNSRETRSRLWWNLFILEKNIAFELGRPVLLRVEETDCPYPSVSEADEFELMSVFARDQGSPEQARSTSIKLRTISGLHTTIDLSLIIERLCREVYGLTSRKRIRVNDGYAEGTRNEIWRSLKDWERDIEASALQLDLSENLTSVPATITNYVMMWTGVIMLHRPYIPRWRPSPDDADADRKNPLQVCLQAASNICLVLEKYFDRLPGLPCDMGFSVFTAASILLYHSKHVQDNDGFETRRRVKLCVQWLSTLGKFCSTTGVRHQIPLDVGYTGTSNGSSNGQPTAYNMQGSTWQSPTTRLPGGAFPATNGQTILPSPPQQQRQAPDDWSFLRSFGDPLDDFYALDVELRDLLTSPN